MSQGSISGLRVFEDFLQTIADTAIADATPEIQPGSGVTIVGTGSALTLASTVDEEGGVLSIDVTDDTANDGFGIFSLPFKPSNGHLALEVRIKTGDMSATNFFVGFQETFTVAEPVMPYTMSGTTITVVDTGQVAGVFVDHNATNKDWHFAASNDAAAATGIDLTNPAISVGKFGSGGRAGVDLSGTDLDDSWIVFRVEVDADGTCRAFVGDALTDPQGNGWKLIGESGKGALDATALLYPIVLVENDGGTGTTSEIDYYLVEAARDWTV